MNPRLHFAFLNAGHFIDHLLPLVFATVAALVLTREWGISYAELIPYATPALVVFGLGALPAGWSAACSQRCVRQPGRGLRGALYEPFD